ncbi:hypothetical protein OMB55_00013490 [gamma proteobacterium HIMB55]|nr:hypothetical protein OMB55_00013490 [gamma proteobacterium HIMB55]
MRFFRSVVNQFVFTGVVLFILNLWLFPEPKPQLGPPNPERVQLQAEALQQLQQTQLTEQQIERIKKRELREELLFVEAVERGVIDQDLVVQRRLIRNMRFMSPERDATDEALLSEAWELRLHLADEVVRRRTVQVMETLIVATQPPYTPTDAELLDEYNKRLSEFEEPARLSFAHVFLRPDSTSERAATLVKAIRAGATPDEARGSSDVFLAGYRFRNASLLDVSRQFGDQFAIELSAKLSDKNNTEGAWLGPLTSIFGQHWVWLDSQTPGRVKTIDEVSVDLIRDLRRAAEDAAVEKWVDAQLASYEVIL